jgi:hypothetical protein
MSRKGLQDFRLVEIQRPQTRNTSIGTPEWRCSRADPLIHDGCGVIARMDKSKDGVVSFCTHSPLDLTVVCFSTHDSSHGSGSGRRLRH